MVKFIDSVLTKFRDCFSRSATYYWFVIVVIGLLTRTDSLGITSFVHCFSFSSKVYDSLIKFFRSDAYSTDDIRKRWYSIVHQSAPLFQLNGRILLAGDGTKEPKEGSHIPGVKKLIQESANSSKPQYIMGHMYGGIAAITEHNSEHYAIPLKLDIEDGLADISSWADNCEHRSSSHVVQMISNGYEVAKHMASSYLVLDRYFLSTSALEKLNALNGSDHILDIITRAKNNCVAYEPLDENSNVKKKSKGRPRKKGKSIKLYELFNTHKELFVRTNVMMYGSRKPVEYLCIDLLWGVTLYQKLRFVLVKSDKGYCIFVSTDITLDPVSIIEAYALRFKIECTFREFKQQIKGFSYHFWSKVMPKLNRYRKSDEGSELSQVNDEHERKLILHTITAIERFVIFSSISLGIVQLMAQTPEIAEKAKRSRYLRTVSNVHVSEATILEYIHKHFFRLLLRNPKLSITQIITTMQNRYFDDDESDIAA